MSRFLLSTQILFLLLLNILLGQEIKVLNYFSNSDSSIINFRDNNNVLIEGGINVSSFQKLNSEIRQGYSFGLTFNYSITNSIGLAIAWKILMPGRRKLNRTEPKRTYFFLIAASRQ